MTALIPGLFVCTIVPAIMSATMAPQLTACVQLWGKQESSAFVTAAQLQSPLVSNIVADLSNYVRCACRPFASVCALLPLLPFPPCFSLAGVPTAAAHAHGRTRNGVLGRPQASSVCRWALGCALIPLGMGTGMYLTYSPSAPSDDVGSVIILVLGLVLFAAVFAVNSAIHSYLIVSFSDKVLSPFLRQ